MKNINKNSILTVLAVTLALGLIGPTIAFAASPAPVDLLSAANFVVLSKTAITTTGVTLITGDIGISPAFSTDTSGFGLTLDGTGTFSTSALLVGKLYAADYAAPTPATMTTAISNMEAAYTDALSRAVDVTDPGAGDLAGLTLVTGTYWFSGPGNVVITGDVTLSGSATDVWIFQIPGNLDISSAKKIILTGGAQASNIFWAVAGTTTLEPGATFEGNILAGPGASTIALQNGAILEGRALGQTDVTFIGNTVSTPVVVVPPPTPTPTPTPAPEPSVHRTNGGSHQSGSSLVTTTITTTTYPATTAFVPGFPNTGFPPKVNNVPWNIVVTGIITLVLTSLYIVLRKHRI